MNFREPLKQAQLLPGNLAGKTAICANQGTMSKSTPTCFAVIKSCKITGARGVHDLYLKFFGSASTIMNLDWWKFEQVASNGSRRYES
jgi:hypothetical protein